MTPHSSQDNASYLGGAALGMTALLGVQRDPANVLAHLGSYLHAAGRPKSAEYSKLNVTRPRVRIVVRSPGESLTITADQKPVARRIYGSVPADAV